SSQLGYEVGLSGFWFVFAMGIGITFFGLFFLNKILNMNVLTISELLYKLFGNRVRIIGAMITAMYTLMISVTQVIAIGALLSVIFHWDLKIAILVGGGVVFIYTILGGMWTLSITDVIQFSVMTIGTLVNVLPSSHLSFTNIGFKEIVGYFITYTLGIVVGQDIWQRFFTGKTKRVAKVSGILVGLYSALYSIVMVVIGMCAFVLFPNIQNTQNVFTHMAFETLQPGLLGIVFAALGAAIMSTASGTLLASSTIIANDLLKPFFFKTMSDKQYLLLTRLTTFGLAIIAMVISLWIKEVLVAIDIAYAILTSAIFVPVILGLFIKWITERAAFLAIIISIVTVFIGLAIVGPNSNLIIILAIILNAITLLGASYYD